MRAALLLANDKPARAARFAQAAQAWCAATGTPTAHVFRFGTAAEMVDPADLCPMEEISHLAIFSHGSPWGFGRPGRFGVETRANRLRTFAPDGALAFVSLDDFADAWRPCLAQGAVVSLAACLCGRAPHEGGVWGPGGYESGGEGSVASLLAILMGKGIEVRAHVAAGDTTNQALLRSFTRGVGTRGVSLYRLCYPTTTPTLKMRRAWQKAVRGYRATRYLLDLCSLDLLRSEIISSMGRAG
jgi:hypothetical protein